MEVDFSKETNTLKIQNDILKMNNLMSEIKNSIENLKESIDQGNNTIRPQKQWKGLRRFS